jgi:hypothetical protein
MPRSFTPGLLALAVVVALICAFPASTAAGILPTQTTQVTLSCTDGHSVVLWADSATLTSLTADVAAINSSSTGTSCALNTAAADPSSETAEWTAYDYNPSNHEIAPRNSPKSMPATTTGTATTFSFLPNVYTALLTTTDPSLTGNLSGRTLSDNISLHDSPGATFMTQDGGGDCVNNVPAAVRFYFVSPSASGPSVGTSPPGTGGTTGAGFYTRFWWSNPMNLPMTSDGGNGTITAMMSDPSEWSDWNGQRGDSSPAVTEAFLEASQNVQTVGLSFGGECFFETGVTANYTTPPPPYEMFTSNFSEF